MKVVIFAGGRGSRLSEETNLKPKPMIEIGDRPILWHIMKLYSHYGFEDFVVCLGYKGYLIKEWFSHYFLHETDMTIDLGQNKTVFHNRPRENWRITFVDTGLKAGTATRLLRIKKYLKEKEFMLTYGDGVGDVDLKKLLLFHRKHGKIATVTAVQPEGRFGAMNVDSKGRVNAFAEKLEHETSWINGGFFVLKPEIFRYLPKKDGMWEQDPLSNLSRDGELMAWRHRGFWHPMDVMRDKQRLQQLWEEGNAPWKVWDR